MTPDTAAHVDYRETGVDPRVLRAVVGIAAELAEYGREGNRVGTVFVVGDEEEVLRRSHPLILDPLAGHPPEDRQILDPQVQGTLRELALLDGAFVVSGDGTVLSAARCLDVSTTNVRVPLGLGSRHQAAASLTGETGALAVVVSQSSSTVRMFHRGQIVDRFEPGCAVAGRQAARPGAGRRPRSASHGLPVWGSAGERPWPTIRSRRRPGARQASGTEAGPPADRARNRSGGRGAQ